MHVNGQLYSLDEGYQYLLEEHSCDFNGHISELADALGWPRRSTLDALYGLADEGKVTKEKSEPRRAIWMLDEV